MKDYVVQSGPLRTFETLFDPRFEKLRRVGDYHTISITGKPTTQRIVIAAMSRSPEREFKFISSLFGALAAGAHAIFGLRDITAGKAAALSRKLSQMKAVRWHQALYGTTEDDLVFLELRNLSEDFRMLQEFLPPKEGSLFCYLTAAAFDVYKIYWERACQGAAKSREDPFRRDLISLAPEAKITLWEDPDGSFTLILHPKVSDVEAVEREVRSAGEKAGMTITSAPSLFG